MCGENHFRIYSCNIRVNLYSHKIGTKNVLVLLVNIVWEKPVSSIHPSFPELCINIYQ